MATQDLYGIKNSRGTFMIPRVSQGKLGLISPEKVNEIDSRINKLYEILEKLQVEGIPETNNSIELIKINELPDLSEAKSNAIYIVPNGSNRNENLCNEYIIVNDQWEVIG